MKTKQLRYNIDFYIPCFDLIGAPPIDLKEIYPYKPPNKQVRPRKKWRKRK